jgi:hypothetical protein
LVKRGEGGEIRITKFITGSWDISVLVCVLSLHPLCVPALFGWKKLEDVGRKKSFAPTDSNPAIWKMDGPSPMKNATFLGHAFSSK